MNRRQNSKRLFLTQKGPQKPKVALLFVWFFSFLGLLLSVGVAKFWRKSIPSSSWFISKAADGCALQAMLQSPHLPSLPSSIGKMSGGRHRFFLGGIWGEPIDRMAKSLAQWGVARPSTGGWLLDFRNRDERKTGVHCRNGVKR